MDDNKRQTSYVESLIKSTLFPTNTIGQWGSGVVFLINGNQYEDTLLRVS